MRASVSGLRRGTYAERRYREGLKTWRRAIHKTLLILLAPIFVGSLIWGISEHNKSAYLAGFLTGMSGAFVVMFREYAPSYVENWGLGYHGEHRTKAVLQKLGWPFVEDIDNGHGNYDHVAVGPSGLFLIESKNYRGTVTIEDDGPRLRRRHDPNENKSLRGDGAQAVRLSIELRDVIEARVGRAQYVNALVIYWNPFPAKRFVQPNVTYLHGSELQSYLEGLPSVVDGDKQAVLQSAVEALGSYEQAA
jgi:hypothetical protein